MRKKGISLGLAAGLLWGIDGVLTGKFTADCNYLLYITLLASCFHDGMAALWIFFVNLKNKRVNEYLPYIRSADFYKTVTASLLGGPIGMTSYILAINLSGAAYACSVTSAYPVIGILLGILLFKEHINAKAFIGIMITAFGASLIGFVSSSENSGDMFYIGLLAAAGAAFCWAAEGSISGNGMENISSDVLIGIREIISASGSAVILMIISISDKEISAAGLLAERNITLLAAASVMGAFSYLCWYRSMNIIGASVGMALNSTYALWAAAADIFLYRTKLTHNGAAGIILILTGTVITVLFHKERKSEYE